MGSKTIKILKTVFWAALAVLLLWFSFKGVDWPEFWRIMRASRWGYVLLAMAAGVFAFIFRSLRWRLLILPVEPDVRRIDCYDGFSIGRICDFVIPHIGNIVRCGYVQTPRLTFDKALGTVVLERTWDVIMLLLLIVVLLVFMGRRFSEFFRDKILGPAADNIGSAGLWIALAVVLLIVAACVFIRYRRRRKSASEASAEESASGKESVFQRVGGFFRGIGQGFSSFIKMKDKGWFLLLTALLWLMYLMMSWFIVKALPVDYGLTIVDALFIMLVGSVAGIVPVPGGFGAFHYLVALALQSLYAIPFDTGIIFATLSHESQAVAMILCGLLSYAHQTLFRRRRKAD